MTDDIPEEINQQPLPIDAGSAVPNFIESFIDEAESGLKNKGYDSCSEIDAHIKLELNAVEVREAGGGLKIHVLSLGGNKSDSNTQKMTIFAKKISEADKAEEKVRITQAEAKEKIIKKMGLSPQMLDKMK